MKKFIYLFFAGLFLASSFIINVPEYTFADSSCDSYILGLPAWYNGLTDANCEVVMPEDEEGAGMTRFIGTIVANITQDLLLAAAYVCVGFVIYAGYLFTTSSGNFSAVEKAKKTISAAIIGMIICLLAYAVVNFVTSVLLFAD